MSVPQNYHEIPEPSTKTSTTIRNTPSTFSLRRIAELWRPDGSRLETVLATLARVSLRLVDRKTGIAYSADELEAKILGQTSADGGDEGDDSSKFVRILDESPISEHLQVSGNLTFDGSSVTIPPLLPSGVKQWTNTGEPLANLINGWALFFNEGTHWSLQKIQSGSAVAIWSGANGATPAQAGGYHPLEGGPYPITGTAIVAQSELSPDHLMQFAVLNDGSGLYACSHMDPVRWLRIDRSDGSELAGIYGKLASANNWLGAQTFVTGFTVVGDINAGGNMNIEGGIVTGGHLQVSQGMEVSGETTFGSEVFFTSDVEAPALTIYEGLTVNGSTVLGNLPSGSITFNGRIRSDIIPDTTNSFDLGSTSNRFKSGWFAGAITATSFTGTGSGLTGTAPSLTAGNATKLATARTINGVSFDGSGNITVPAAGSTLTDTVPASKGGTGITSLGAGVPTLLGGTSSGSGGIAGTVSPTFTGQGTISGATFPVFNTVRTSAVTNSSLGTLALTHSTTGDATDGFGPTLFFQMTDSGISNSLLASIGAVRSGSDTTGAIVFSPVNGGGSSEKVRISPTGNVLIGSSNGTSSSSKFLHIQDASSAGITMERTGATAGKWSFFTKGTGGDFGFYDELNSRYVLNLRKSDGAVETPSGISSAGQVELTGQSATNATSAMTRDLQAIEKLWSMHRVRRFMPESNGSSGTGSFSSVNANGGQINSGTATSGYAELLGSYLVTGNPNVTGAANNAAVPMIFSHVLVMYLPDRTTTRRQVIRFVCGAPGGVPPVAGADPLGAPGFGYEIYYNLSNTRLEIVPFVYKTAFSYGTPAPFAFTEDGHCHIICENTGTGTINLYAGIAPGNGAMPRPSTTPIATMTGAPTGLLGGGVTKWLTTNASSGTISASTNVKVLDSVLKIN